MSNSIHVAAAALNQTPIDWENNCTNICAAIETARARGVALLCLPELALTGYGCEDLFLSDWIYESAIKCLAQILPNTQAIAVAVGLPIKIEQHRYNGVALLVDGKIAGITLKQNLDRGGVYYEPRWFNPWIRGAHKSILILGAKVPVGDLIFKLGSVRIAFEICQDAWVQDRLAQHFANQGVDLILNPSASYFTFGKHSVRREICVVGSRLANVGYVYANLLGCESGRLIFDGDCIIAAEGKVIANSTRLSFDKFTLVSAELAINSGVNRATYPGLDESAPSLVVSVNPFPMDRSIPHVTGELSQSWENSQTLKEEEFSRAVALGLFDYLRKSRAQGFALSLSGGVDSSSCAALVRLMVELGIHAIGIKEFLAALPDIDSLRELKEPNLNLIVHNLLTCAYQGTQNNSPAAIDSARSIASAINATFYELQIDPLVTCYTHLIEGAIGRKLEWERDDLALQNIQARTRSPSIWLLANIERKLLLATSNRSEATLGYSTMDGDTSGGLSPLAGVDKSFLMRWLKWLETEGPIGASPIPALATANSLTPGPELRPLSANQSGEDDLMPFTISSALQRIALVERKDPRAAYATLVSQFVPQFESQQLRSWVCRFYRLWSANQWKRERLAPSFHLDDFNIDPKTWCRFPILSGGFEQELIALQNEEQL